MQRGAHAMEYALVFPVFFALLYGTILYGMVFTTRLSLQHASEEGARAALRYQTPAAGFTQLQLRIAEATRIAATQTAWLNGFQAPQICAYVCLAGIPCPAAAAVPPATCSTQTAPACGEDLSTSCQIVVTVTYPYSTRPIIPGLPGFGVLVPTSLQGRAHALLDGRSL